MLKELRDLIKLGKTNIDECANEYSGVSLHYWKDLRCYVVIELKTGDFKPEYAGQLNFYLSAVECTSKSRCRNPCVR